MSRSLKPTRPSSSLLILACDARIRSPAASHVIPAASRRRRSWVPMTMRRTVGLPVRLGSNGAGPPSTARPAATMAGSFPWREVLDQGQLNHRDTARCTSGCGVREERRDVFGQWNCTPIVQMYVQMTLHAHRTEGTMTGDLEPQES